MSVCLVAASSDRLLLIFRFFPRVSLCVVGGSEGPGSVSQSQSRNSVGMASVMTSEADDGAEDDD